MDLQRGAFVPQAGFLAGLGRGELIDGLAGAPGRDDALAYAAGLMVQHLRSFSDDGAAISSASRKLLHAFTAGDLRELSRTILRTRGRMGEGDSVRFAFNKMLLIKGMPLLPASPAALRKLGGPAESRGWR